MTVEDEAEQYARETLGMDTVRIWATECAVHESGGLSLLVFRETASVKITGEDGEDAIREVRKNVASILMTSENAKVLGKILNDRFSEDVEEDG